MNENPFYRLAPFIQDYIYRQQWSALRSVQVDAINAILDTDDHILISSGTASGKTEAALLPILTTITTSPPASIGVLYIGPLKALINDQFERLTGLLEETNIPVQSWHGDVPQSKKQRFLRSAQGILQITPESLEAMLINRTSDLSRLFGDLRFVVIDEVHAFIDTDRGRQVICQLERLARYQQTPPRRIGLSATIGEPKLAEHWLAGNGEKKVHTISDSAAGRSIELGLEHYIIDPDEEEDESPPATEQDQPSDQPTSPDFQHQLQPTTERILYKHIYGMTQGAQKTLIFANSRSGVEITATNLRSLSTEHRQPDIYFVHHGSISTSLRETAESVMRDPAQQACVVATVTLELGIDIGNLDQVLQLNATHTVSSFVQRLGRSGRRNSPSRMFFYSVEDLPPAKAALGKLIPWNFLQTIATIQLYLDEKWVEPPAIPTLPFSLLYHQTMSTLAARTELAPPQLAQAVLTLSPFRSVTTDHYRSLLQHLIEIQHMEKMETGTLIIGRKAEQIVNNYRFYATFEDDTGLRVLHRSTEIGTIHGIPIQDDIIGLAGYAWKVLSVDLDNKVIQVERSRGKPKPLWRGGGISIHTKLLQKIRSLLSEQTETIYLHDGAKARLAVARNLAHQSQLLTKAVIPLGGQRFMFLPWVGTRTYNTIDLLLSHANVNVVGGLTPYYMEIQSDSIDSFRSAVRDMLASPPSPATLAGTLRPEELQAAKFDRFIPEDLLRQAFIQDMLDIPAALTALSAAMAETKIDMNPKT